MKKTFTAKAALLIAAFISFSFISCDNIYSGGTGGHVVDSESTSSPKAGIAYVDIYAYMNKTQRDSDYSKWQEGTVFKPTVSYYGHTTSNTDGSFSISRLLWKESKPDFGKDADYTKVYFIFYHKNYGLVKDETIIISDSTTDTITVEMTSIRKTTNLTLNFTDVTSGTNTPVPLTVEVSVPQTTATLTDAKPTVYKATITGTGTIAVSYPRWQNETDRTNGIETTPSVTVKYQQNAEPDSIIWKACWNEDNEEKNFAFRTDADLSHTGINKQISGDSYPLSFYLKTTKPSFPTISGQYKKNGDETDDGIVIKMKAQINTDGTYALDCGQVTTSAQTLGTSGQQKHGNFSGLGSGYTWTDETYTGRYTTATVLVTDDDPVSPVFKEFEVRSDVSEMTVQLY